MQAMRTLATLSALLLLAVAACAPMAARTPRSTQDAGREAGAALLTAQETGANEPVPAAASPGCGKSHPLGLSLKSLTSGGVLRSYRVYVPRSYVNSAAMPLVINYHGYGSSAQEQERYSRMTAEAERSGFITVAPDGTNNPRRWYIYGKLEPGYVDDFAFTRDLVSRLQADLCIDAKRIYATGISNGGAMSAISGCELSSIFAAVAPVAGTPFPEASCRGKPPVPIVAFHGTADKLVPFNGGPSGRLGLPGQPVRDNIRNWARHNQCNPALQTTRIASDVVLESYGGCANGADVQLYVIEGGGHTWPGSSGGELLLGPSTKSIDATAIIWAFFQAHPKP